MSTVLQGAGPVPALKAGEAHAIGADACIYFYPLMLMDLTRKLAKGRSANRQVEPTTSQESGEDLTDGNPVEWFDMSLKSILL